MGVPVSSITINTSWGLAILTITICLSSVKNSLNKFGTTGCTPKAIPDTSPNPMVFFKK